MPRKPHRYPFELMKMSADRMTIFGRAYFATQAEAEQAAADYLKYYSHNVAEIININERSETL